ncbi:MAG TPA: hypothetical protein PKI01_01140 [Bacteroidales bacterium]|nr:hypothetical protein [Bacteroidales bacterium]
MIKRNYKLFSKSTKLAILNGGLISIIIAFNIYFQSFCIPTTWAIIVLAICFTNTILYPILENTGIAPLTSFINGITFFVFLYCVVFLDGMNLLGLFIIIVGLGLVIYIPHFFIIQLFWKNLVKPKVKTSRYYFLTAIFLCVGTVVYIGQEYKKAIISIEKFKASNYTELDRNFMTEKILGMHFIYHTRIEMIWDGWRPPKHEPILIIGMWLNNRIDPLNVDLETRLKLYKKFFPEKKYKFDCSCGIQYNKDYHNDDLWKK